MQRIVLGPGITDHTGVGVINAVNTSQGWAVLAEDTFEGTYTLTRLEVAQDGTVHRSGTQQVGGLIVPVFITGITLQRASDGSVMLLSDALRSSADLDQPLLTVVMLRSAANGGNLRDQIEIASDDNVEVLPVAIGEDTGFSYIVEDANFLEGTSSYTLFSVSVSDGGMQSTQVAQLTGLPIFCKTLTLADGTIWLNTLGDYTALHAPEGEVFNGHLDADLNTTSLAVGNRIVELFTTSNASGAVTDYAIFSRDEGAVVTGGRIAGGRQEFTSSINRAAVVEIEGIGFAAYREILSATSDAFTVLVDIIDMDGDRIGTLNLTQGMAEDFVLRQLAASVSGGNIVIAALGDESSGFRELAVAYTDKLSAALNLTGTDKGELLRGLGLADVLDGRGGDDRFSIGAGNDTVFGGDGNDSVFGKGGNKHLEGGEGDDGFALEGGNHLILCGGGDDVVLLTGTGASIVFGGFGSDDISGSDGAEKLIGDGDNDSIRGGGGNDTLKGGLGGDSLFGGKGNDRLFDDTAEADDFLFGGAGFDQLHSEGGNDTLQGGDAVDRFFIEFGHDATITIADFDQGRERIVFDRFVAKSMADLTISTSATGELIQLADGLNVLVLGVELLLESDFIFS